MGASKGTLMILGFVICSLCLRSEQSSALHASVEPGPQGVGTQNSSGSGATTEADPNTPLPLARLGLQQAREGHYPQAIGLYRRAFALDPDLPGLRLNLGLALFKDGQYQPALHLFNELLQQPQTPSEKSRLLFLSGMSHYGLAEYQAAVPFLQQATSNDTHNLPLLLTLAHSCLLSRQYPCVLDAYHQIIAQDATSAEADMLAGEALDEMKDENAAIIEFRAAVQANPKEPNAHFGLGYLLWTQQQLDEAVKEFRAELVNTPDHAQAMLYLADALMKLNMQEEAEALLLRVVHLKPTSSLAHVDLGEIYEDHGRTNDALREFQQGVALDPESVKAHMKLGRLYRSLGKLSDAQKEFLTVKNIHDTSRGHVMAVMPNPSGLGDVAK